MAIDGLGLAASLWQVTVFASPCDGGRPIFQYEIQSRHEESDWHDVLTIAADTAHAPCGSAEHVLTAKIVALLPAHTYTFRVRAVNCVGAGEYSDSSAAAATGDHACCDTSLRRSASYRVSVWQGRRLRAGQRRCA